jgi:DNA-binding transcriptional LysR family regulator
MEIRQLATFQTIVQRGSFLRAAEALDVAQSTVTLHVQQLEAELGVQLFTRQGRRMQLTEAGRTLRDQAADLLNREAILRQTMADLAGGEAGHVRLGAIEPTASLRLPPVLVHFCRKRPKVRLQLEVGGSAGISQLVAAGHLDFGICSPPVAQLGLTFTPLFVEPMALLMPADWPLAAQPTLRTADLLDGRLMLTDQSCAYRQVIERALLESGTNPYSGIEISSMDALVRAVQGGLGMAIVPVAIASPPPPGTVLKQIEGHQLALPVGLVQRPDDLPPSAALAALITATRSELRAANPTLRSAY